MTKIEMGKQYKTRSGLPVRILCTDNGRSYPVVGLIEGDTSPRRYDENGLYYTTDKCDLDLVEVKPRIKREVWINVYGINQYYAYESKTEADRQSSISRLACIPITIDCEHGEGLT